jgi:hypothetical protein
MVARFNNFISVLFPFIYFARGLCTRIPGAPVQEALDYFQKKIDEFGNIQND